MEEFARAHRSLMTENQTLGTEVKWVLLPYRVNRAITS
jgi:hypothetical protein